MEAWSPSESVVTQWELFYPAAAVTRRMHHASQLRQRHKGIEAMHLLYHAELIAFAISIFVLCFMAIRRDQLTVIRGPMLLAGAFGMLFAGYFMMVVWSLTGWAGWRLLEQVCYAANVWMMACWTWKYLGGKETNA
jgi:hypothetical protein